MEMEILVYSFQHNEHRNISFEVMQQLKNVNCLVINCTDIKIGKTDIDTLVNLVKNNKFNYVIGIGIHSYNNQNIKIEKIAKNKFRNNIITTAPYRFYHISEFLPDCNETSPLNVVFSSKMGNSWCNYSAFSIRHEIEMSKLDTLNGFIHIPNNPDYIGAYVKFVQEIINSLQNQILLCQSQ